MLKTSIQSDVSSQAPIRRRLLHRQADLLLSEPTLPHPVLAVRGENLAHLGESGNGENVREDFISPLATR